MKPKAVAALSCLILVTFVFTALAVDAGRCIDGGCHEAIVAPKYLHGPVAAEEAGVEGCASCHVPTGSPCTATRAGKYRFKTKQERLCLLCHERGTSTQHTRASSKCLSCHSPHGSDSGSTLMRAG